MPLSVPPVRVDDHEPGVEAVGRLQKEDAVEQLDGIVREGFLPALFARDSTSAGGRSAR